MSGSTSPRWLQEVDEDERFSPERVARALTGTGKAAAALDGAVEIAAHVARACRLGDVVLVLSNGDFGGLIPKLLEALPKARAAGQGA